MLDLQRHSEHRRAGWDGRMRDWIGCYCLDRSQLLMLNKWTSLATFIVCLAGIYYCWHDDSGGIVLFTFGAAVCGALTYFEWRK